MNFIILSNEEDTLKIISNYNISENSLNEFLRVLIPEAENNIFKVEFSEDEKKLYLKIECDNLIEKYEIKNYQEKIEDQKKIFLKTSLLKFYNKSYSWGGLIGVRPTKVVKKLFALKFSENEIKEILKDLYLVNSEKSRLLMDVLEKEKKIMNKNGTNIYIGIPFCSTKCKFCSFASYEINSPVGKYYDNFLNSLLEEITLTGELIKNNKIMIESIYVGGGTPSILREKDLEKVLIKIQQEIPKIELKEFTFEAGREDSITDEKLELCKKYGVNRISLNPQTFNEITLKNMNRKFDRLHFNKCYLKIKELGLILNMDLILGLPGENEEDMLATLEEIRKFDIENLTIHNLALKKASVLSKELKEENIEIKYEIVEQKIKEIIEEKKMFPYYMYRQKNSADWGENIGYSIEGKESIFNIEMIEENQSTLGIGGGAITKKIKYIDEIKYDIIRVINPKEPATYIREMKDRFLGKIKIFQKILSITLMVLNLSLLVGPLSTDLYGKGELIFGSNTITNRDLRLDLNETNLEELLNSGITMKISKKIIEYRDITGGFTSVNELKRISGIGDATLKKLLLKLKIEKDFQKKTLNINTKNDIELKYFGFTKKEIKKIRKYQKEHIKIENNLILMELLTEKRYNIYRDIVDYN
jgi:oxygen-independent coproporphyrinogen-3 oxidase